MLNTVPYNRNQVGFSGLFGPGPRAIEAARAFAERSTELAKKLALTHEIPPIAHVNDLAVHLHRRTIGETGDFLKTLKDHAVNSDINRRSGIAEVLSNIADRSSIDNQHKKANLLYRHASQYFMDVIRNSKVRKAIED